MAGPNGDESAPATPTRSRLGRLGCAGVGFAAGDGGYAVDDYAAGETGWYGMQFRNDDHDKKIRWADEKTRSRHRFDTAGYRAERCRQGHYHVPQS